MTTLLVTNDFPPTVGGIQSYLRDYVDELVKREGPESIIVLASVQEADAAREWDAEQSFAVIRWPRNIMLPTPGLAREMARIIRTHSIDTVWFGAAAPLAILGAQAKRAGAKRVVATTHGHEVGWAMIPVARQVLRRIGRSADVVTYISRFTIERLQAVFGDDVDYVALPSGVDTDFFAPASAHKRDETRRWLGVGDAPLVVCSSRLVPRKGQDVLIRALPEIRRYAPNARLVIVGEGPYEQRLRKLAASSLGVEFTGRVSRERLRDIVAAADVFAMPARTRWGGLDVEGLGIVYLEAQACGVAVVAGDSGGAPETVVPESGVVVNGRDVNEVARSIGQLLCDDHRTAMGTAGRKHVQREFSWGTLGERLRDVLAG